MKIMHRKEVFTLLIFAYIVGILLIVSCISTSKTAYYGGTMFIPLKSSPEGVKVILDGKMKGFTPMTLEFWYFKTKKGIPNDETQERILKIEKDGYEPYILSFSITGKEYEKIPSSIILKKLNDTVKAIDLLGKEQQKTQELIETKKKVEETLKENEKLEEEISLLKEKKDTQEIKQYNEIIVNNNQYEYQIIYTIQTGSFPDIKAAEREFDFIEQTLEENQLDYLRIEKVGIFYAVRIGKFKDYTTADKFIRIIQPQRSTAIILKAYIKDERIIKLYNESKSSAR